MSNDKVVVKFAKPWRGYSAGESAGFSADQSKALVDGKVAEYTKAGAAAAKKAAAKGAAAETAAPATAAAATGPAATDTGAGDDDGKP